MEMEFEFNPGFCACCGSILPILQGQGNVQCYLCKEQYGPEAFGTMETTYKILFNSRDTYTKSSNKSNANSEGPIVERRCGKCGYGKMSYATLQLRSADEGQTVFYTCIKCKFKETENS